MTVMSFLILDALSSWLLDYQ